MSLREEFKKTIHTYSERNAEGEDVINFNNYSVDDLVSDLEIDIRKFLKKITLSDLVDMVY